MKSHTAKSAGRKITSQWDGRDFLGRLNLIMEERHLFWSLGLVTKSELERVVQMSQSAKEYVLLREEKPFFESIHLKEDTEEQSHCKKLMAALSAVFL